MTVCGGGGGHRKGRGGLSCSRLPTIQQAVYNMWYSLASDMNQRVSAGCVLGVGCGVWKGEVGPQLYQTAHHPIAYSMWYSVASDMNQSVSNGR